MSQYPVLTSQGIKEGVNYLLSGPQGLGQNFDGFSSSTVTFLINSVNQPHTTTTYNTSGFGYLGNNYFTVGSNANITTTMLASGVGIPNNSTVSTVSGNTITISNNLYTNLNNSNVSFTQIASLNTIVALANTVTTDGYTFHSTFTSTLSSIPYIVGTGVEILNFTTANYNASYTVIGCTTSNATLKSSAYITPAGNIAGGNLELITTSYFSATPYYISTDCVGNATTTGNTDRVFLSGEIDYVANMTYVNGPDWTCGVTSAINRYKKIIKPNGNSANNLQQTYTYVFDSTIATNIHIFTVNSGNTSFSYNDNFVSYIDSPGIGTYQYRIDLSFNTYTQNVSYTAPYIQSCELIDRSLTSQVVKQ